MACPIRRWAGESTGNAGFAYTFSVSKEKLRLSGISDSFHFFNVVPE